MSKLSDITVVKTWKCAVKVMSWEMVSASQTGQKKRHMDEP